jgi:fatty acid desaturase
MSRARRTHLLSEDELHGLMQKSDGAGFNALLIHFSLLILFCTGSLALPAIPGVLSWFVYAIVLVFLFCPLHEVIHETAFASRPANRVVGFLLGLVLLLPPRYFRAFHMTHHRYTQDPERDPELISPKPSGLWQYIHHISGFPFWLGQARVIVRNAFGDFDEFVPVSQRGALVFEARLYLIIYALAIAISLVVGSTALWWYWVVPVLLGQPFLRLFLLAEHTGCPLERSMFSNTRTTLTNAVMRRLCWNMNFHTEHHAYAGIPFHRLPESHVLLRGHLRNIGQGYVRVNRTILQNVVAGNEIRSM